MQMSRSDPLHFQIFRCISCQFKHFGRQILQNCRTINCCRCPNTTMRSGSGKTWPCWDVSYFLIKTPGLLPLSEWSAQICLRWAHISTTLVELLFKYEMYLQKVSSCARYFLRFTRFVGSNLQVFYKNSLSKEHLCYLLVKRIIFEQMQHFAPPTI